MNSIKTWIEIALNDLHSARHLHKNGYYRNAYFLFQQAAEKANKAFAIYAGLLKEDGLAEIGHNQFKIYRKSIVKHEEELNQLIKTTEKLPSKVKNHEIFGHKTILSLHQGQKEILKVIDGLKDQDLINISSIELNQLYKQLISLRESEINLPKNIDKEFKKAILKIADWAGSFETAEAITAKKDFMEFANDKGKSKELNAAMIQILRVTSDFAFIFYSLWFCAILTIQHSSLTRYPVNGKNPLKIYTLKLPLVKKQPLFMDLLEEVLLKLSKLNE